MADHSKMIAALRLEREGYVDRELPDRVQQVDKQIAALLRIDDAHNEVTAPTVTGPKGRRAAKPSEMT